MKILIVLLIAASAAAAPVAFVNAKLYTISNGVIADGTLIVDGGKITAVGPAQSVTIPAGAERINARGKVIMPGIVDTHSHIGASQIGGGDINEGSGPTQSGLRIIDAILPSAETVRMAVAAGVTTANIMPGSGNIMGGQTAYVKLRGRTVEEMLIDNNGITGGMKMANGDNPKNYRTRGQAPFTRMGVAALQRRIFVRGQAYKQKWDDFAAGKEAKRPDRDIDLEPVKEVLEGKRMVHFHTHRADDVMSVLRLADEFKFRVVLQHVSEGYQVAEEIAKRNIPASIIMVDSPGGKLETAELDPEGAAILEKAGVKLAFHSDDSVVQSRFLMRSAAFAVRHGMTAEGALRALTLNPAEMLDLGSRLGSLTPGKDADFLVLSGEPFSVYTNVLETWIDGKKVFDRAKKADRLYQTGGFAVLDRYPSLGGVQ